VHIAITQFVRCKQLKNKNMLVARYRAMLIGWMRCDIRMASSVVSERRKAVAAAAAAVVLAS